MPVGIGDRDFNARPDTVDFRDFRLALPAARPAGQAR